jgi:hypothetical protein
MNEKINNLSDEAFAQQIMQEARGIQPDKAFAAELEQRLMQSASSRMSSASPRRMIRMLGTMAAIFVFIVVATFNVPSLRAIAQEFIVLLSHTKADEGTGYYMEEPAEQLFASLEKAETDLGRDFLVPQYFPSITIDNKVIPVKFRMLRYRPDTATVQIEYTFGVSSPWSLTLMQIPGEIYHKNGGTSVGASADIETVTFNFRGQPVSGQFVKGGWITRVDPEHRNQIPLQTPTAIDLEWSAESKQMYLIWEADGIVYQFITGESSQLEINRDALIRIAESIK